ncbi:hypothetical protein ACQP1W_44625 [Spirillospora sp. CA-255316]
MNRQYPSGFDVFGVSPAVNAAVQGVMGAANLDSRDRGIRLLVVAPPALYLDGYGRRRHAFLPAPDGFHVPE